MNDKEKIENRQKLNRQILAKLKFNEAFNEALSKDDLIYNFYNYMEKYIEECPEQRFGQIIYNYVDDAIMNKEAYEIIWSGLEDPFYEESYTTLKRL